MLIEINFYKYTKSELYKQVSIKGKLIDETTKLPIECEQMELFTSSKSFFSLFGPTKLSTTKTNKNGEFTICYQERSDKNPDNQYRLSFGELNDYFYKDTILIQNKIWNTPTDLGIIALQQKAKVVINFKNEITPINTYSFFSFSYNTYSSLGINIDNSNMPYSTTIETSPLTKTYLSVQLFKNNIHQKTILDSAQFQWKANNNFTFKW